MRECSVNRRVRSSIRAEKAIKQSAKLPGIQIEFVFLDDAKEVTSVQYYGMETHGYPTCPSCGFGVEREYQNYCEVCGQRLLWNRFAKGKVTVKRFMGKK